MSARSNRRFRVSNSAADLRVGHNGSFGSDCREAQASSPRQVPVGRSSKVFGPRPPAGRALRDAVRSRSLRRGDVGVWRRSRSLRRSWSWRIGASTCGTRTETARRQLAAVTQCGCGRGGFFEGCRRREDGDRVPRSPSGGSGRGKPGNATNLMTGNGMQQARGRLRGENRRGGARPRGRNGSRRVAPSARRRASTSASCPLFGGRHRGRRPAGSGRANESTVEGGPRTPERQERSAFERARCSGRSTSALNATRKSGRRHPAVSAAGPVHMEFLEGPDRRRSKTMEGSRKGQRPATR